MILFCSNCIIVFQVFTDGITNKLVGCMHEEDSDGTDIVLIRVYGKKTDLIIDRRAEATNMQVRGSASFSENVINDFHI